MAHVTIALLVNVSIVANSVDTDQTAPVGSGSTLFSKEVSETFQQTAKADDLCCDWRFKGQTIYQTFE